MKIMRTAVQSLLTIFAITATAHAASIVYIFAGTASVGGQPLPEAFQLTVPDFISPLLDGPGVDIACAQLDSSTNCSSIGLIFSDQSVLGAFPDQLEFFSPDSGDSFFFPAGAFTTPGVYNSEEGINNNIGSLTVEQTPEPTSMVLLLGAGLLFLSGRMTKHKRRVLRHD